MDTPYVHKTLRYLREIGFCLRVGERPRDKVRLARDTVRFHFRHLRNGAPSATGSSYRIKWGGRTHDLQLRPFAGDFFIFHEVFLDEPYWIPAEYARSASTVVDLGANVGLASLYLSGLVPAARFVCVEPNPTNIPLLRHNLSSVGAHAEVVEAAVSSRTEPVQFAADGPAWGTKLASGTKSGVEVQGCTMLDLMDDQNIDEIDILKIDVEGAERLLFEGATAWLDRVRLLMVELHDEYPVETFRTTVRSKGFDVFEQGSAFGNNILTATRAH